MSAKCLDRKGRWRKVTVAFSASPEENEQIAAFAKLCGMTKQDYMLSRLLQKEVIVQGNPRVYKALKAELREVNAKLLQVIKNEEASSDMLEMLQFTLTILKGMCEEHNERKQTGR